MEFFTKKEVKQKLDTQLLFNASGLSSEITARYRIVINIIKLIKSNEAEWDEKCTFNNSYISEKFHRLLQEENISLIDEIFIILLRYYCEFEFNSDHKTRENLADRYIISDSLKCIDDLEGNLKRTAYFAIYEMPAKMLRYYFDDPKSDAILKLGPLLDNATNRYREIESELERLEARQEESLEEWDKKLKDREKKAEALEARLHNYETAFNFVGLYKGFSDLVKAKKSESKWLLVTLSIMGALILLPLLLSAYHTLSASSEAAITIQTYLPLFLPLISLELILIYFFRVVLLNHKSVKTQIVQLELRQTLCQFIQDYAEYASDIKTSDQNILEKFENLIFSGIVINPEQVPSTFDGMDQITNLMKSFKK